MDDGDNPGFGSCCICEGDLGDARNIVVLPIRGVVAGHGWGCVVCKLPLDGASAVLCNPCVRRYMAGKVGLRFACRGYPGTDGRVAIAELVEPFEHNPRVKH